MKHLDIFLDSTQESVTGTVRIKFTAGNVIVVGRKSKYWLFNYNEYKTQTVQDNKFAEGYIYFLGLAEENNVRRRN